jgi:hypothetical protein
LQSTGQVFQKADFAALSDPLRTLALNCEVLHEPFLTNSDWRFCATAKGFGPFILGSEVLVPQWFTPSQNP